LLLISSATKETSTILLLSLGEERRFLLIVVVIQPTKKRIGLGLILILVLCTKTAKEAASSSICLVVGLTEKSSTRWLRAKEAPGVCCIVRSSESTCCVGCRLGSAE
jgi:hypothetical protein